MQPALTSELQTALDNKNWPLVERLGLAVIAKSPMHVPTLLALVDASLATGDLDGGDVYLSIAGDTAPNDPEVHKRRGLSLAKQHRFEEALAAWQRVDELSPGDLAAAQNTAFILAQQSRRRHDWELFDPEFVNFAVKREAKKLKEAKSLGKAASSVVQEPDRAKVQELELAISRIPSDADLYLQLAQLHLQTGKEFEAERLLTKAKEATESEPRVLHLWQEVTIKRLNSKVAAAEQALTQDDSQAARDAASQARGERDRGEILIFAARCKREPKNLQLRYELAIRHKRAGKLEEAIKGFREVLHEPSLFAVASLALGECSEQFDDVPQALEHFRNAAKAASEPAHWNIRVEALFRAAKLTARLKLYRLAARYVGDLLQIEPNHAEALEFRDGLRA